MTLTHVKTCSIDNVRCNLWAQLCPLFVSLWSNSLNTRANQTFIVLLWEALSFQCSLQLILKSKSRHSEPLQLSANSLHVFVWYKRYQADEKGTSWVCLHRCVQIIACTANTGSVSFGVSLDLLSCATTWLQGKVKASWYNTSFPHSNSYFNKNMLREISEWPPMCVCVCVQLSKSMLSIV